MKNLSKHYLLLQKQLYTGVYLRYFFVILLIPFWGVLYYFFAKHIGEFGCFDDCNNFMGGYFLLHGKKIFSEFFFNHQMLMANISYLVQAAFHPQTLYSLVTYHRLLVFAFSVVAGSYLVIRFGLSAVGFVLLFEVNKYYIFGNRFLAESFVVYLMVFMLGVIWQKLHKKPVYLSDYIMSGVSTWFVLFIREPYIPLALFLFVLVLWGKTQIKEKSIAVGIFFICTIITLLSISVPDMILNIYTLNKQLITGETAQTGTNGLGFLKNIFYPVVILFQGKWTILRHIQIITSLVYLSLSSYVFFLKKQRVTVLLVWGILIIANFRFVEPGFMYYEAFHIMVWTGLTLFSSMLMLSVVENVQIKKLILGVLAGLLLYSLFSPQTIFWKKIDTQKEFTEGYGHYYITGTIIKTLSHANFTLFVEKKDDMIYWQADIQPAYKYLWYTSLMPSYKPYVIARDEMFTKYPPDFYFGDCDKYHKHAQSLPANRVTDYQQMLFEKELSCIYVKKSLIPTIPAKKLQEAAALGYHF